ncbi:hypothetical protein B0H17DRAFT_1150936 [Mycena rosella]|uniref:Uncharacterized protein n=1 Tax=Mycena rosella TaxID=1033263 RepID=A0AAD7BP05_MYCRO|nr:hypothetical protein B0H17DRAFT_1150936 [Mycena rosella]
MLQIRADLVGTGAYPRALENLGQILETESTVGICARASSAGFRRGLMDMDESGRTDADVSGTVDVGAERDGGAEWGPMAPTMQTSGSTSSHPRCRKTIPSASVGASMDSAAPKPTGTHGGKRARSGRKKKIPTLGNPPQNPGNSERRRPTRPAQTSSRNTSWEPIEHLRTYGETGILVGYLEHSRPQSENPQPSQPGFDANNANRSQISPAEFDQLAHQLKFIDENDEYAEIASGDKVINDSLVDAILEASGTNLTTEPVESSSSEAVNNSVLQNQFAELRAKLSHEITEYGWPLCYCRGDFYERPPHPYR